ncbi:MAG: sigma-54-dependent Fis family transcriptional regulator [Planctomycetes bacterium]|nr:sigma-54-dependent Fis family transcriptional regulator [Planctomycetota bacterium]
MIGGRFGEFLSRLRGATGDRDRTRLAAILRLNRALASAEDRQALLVGLLDEAVVLFRAERGFVVERVVDSAPATRPYRVVAARNLDREDVRRPDEKVSSTVVRQSLEQDLAVFVEDASLGDDPVAAARSVADLRLRSVLCVPLRAGERAVGALYLDHRFHANAFDPDDLPWLEAFADQAAIALHLHELVDRLRQRSAAAERDNQRLAAAVAAQEQRMATLAAITRAELDHDYAEVVGESPALLRHLRLLDRVCAAGDFPVLLIAESGCGKELAARAIHRYGRRAHGPFVAINVAALRPELVESELFGHVRGAFTGADRDRPGLIREADGGVLFLDEVTEMPLDAQAKLLRFLEDRRVRPVGGDVAVEVELRIVAATNRDPLRAVRDGRFREDLYYRLAVVTVPLPALRDRLADLPPLVEHFLAEAAQGRGGTPRRASPALLAALARRRWPGNLRELRNVLLRLDALADGDVIGDELLEPEPADGLGAGVEVLDLATLERRAIARALERAAGNKAEAARLLGISRRSLYDRLQRDPEPGS